MKKLFSKTKFPQLPTPNSKLRTDSGLTFIELIVVAAIFSILAAVSLFRFGGFTANVSLQNVTQDIALRLVQAQRDGSSGSYPRFINPGVQAPFISSTPAWIPKFGIHFSIDQVQGFSDTFVYFFDSTTLPGLDRYDDNTSDICDGSNECLDLVTINSGDKIVGLCVETLSILCVNNPDGTFITGAEADELDILFKRPNLSAIISPYASNGTLLNGPFTAAKISVQSKDGAHYKVITVYPVGQITVE